MSWKHQVIESKDGDGDLMFVITEVYNIEGETYTKPVISESSLEELEQTVGRLKEAILKYKQSLS